MSDGGDCGGHSGDCGHNGHGGGHVAGDGGGIFYFGGAEGPEGKSSKPLTKKQTIAFVAVVGAIGALILYKNFKDRHPDESHAPQR